MQLVFRKKRVRIRDTRVPTSGQRPSGEARNPAPLLELRVVCRLLERARMGTFVADLKYGARLLWRTPVVSIIAILTLALGIGANTAIFTVVHAVVMRPLPYPQADRLVQLYTQFPTMKFDKFWFSSPEFLDLQAQARSYKSIGAYQLGGAPVIGGEVPVRAVTAYCSPSLLPMIGVEPMLGASSLPTRTSRIIRRAWCSATGCGSGCSAAIPHIVGRSIRVDSDATHVVGVMP